MSGTDRPARTVDLYFDYVSPYSYIALARAGAFAAAHGVAFRPRPVLYAAILDATGLVGPVETGIKRRYTAHDVARTAALHGIPLAGPPAHPFRTLEALRATRLYLDDPRALALATALAAAAWGAGRDLTDWAVIEDVVAGVGLDAADLRARASTPAAKADLRAGTDAALAAGVFGVPTFAWEGELFWGHDRLDHLAARLSGALADPRERAESLLARPFGAMRPAAPIARGDG